LKKLSLIASLAASLFLNPLSVNADLLTLYDIDFESPTYTAGSAPSIGTDIDQVSGIVFGMPTVESTASAGQFLQFNANSSTYEQIRLNMGQDYDNYQISFDFMSSNLSGSDYAFTLLADTPTVRIFSFIGTTGVRYWAPFVQPINGGNFADNTSYHVSIDYDLLVGSVSVWLNDGLLGTRSFDTSGDDIESFRFSLSPAMGGAGLDPSISVNLDNILVTTRTASVPEPSTFLLLSMGLIGVVSVRKFTGSKCCAQA
jgi:hypothetical protein